MSADNWTECPQCARNDDARTMLGRGPDTLREDYEIGMTANGLLSIDYSCSCKKCGFRYEYAQEVSVELKQAKRPSDG